MLWTQLQVTFFCSSLSPCSAFLISFVGIIVTISIIGIDFNLNLIFHKGMQLLQIASPFEYQVCPLHSARVTPSEPG